MSLNLFTNYYDTSNHIDTQPIDTKKRHLVCRFFFKYAFFEIIRPSFEVILK